MSTRSLAALVVLLAPLALAEDKPLVFGISTPYGAEAAAKVPALVEPYLSKALKGPVKAQVFASGDELADALAQGKVDLAWITPLAFVRASQKNPEVTALSKAMRSGGLFYRAVFVVKKDSAFKALPDVKGKKVAWVSKGSTSGYLFSREMLKQAGEAPDGFFSGETFAGDHLAVCRAVREGTADVGATFGAEPGEGKEVQATGCEDAGPVSDFRVIASTGNLPNEVIAVRDFFPPGKVNDVIAAFGRMGLSDEGKKLLKDAFRVDGWGVAVDGDFAPVLALLKASDVKAKTATPADASKAPAGKKKGSK